MFEERNSICLPEELPPQLIVVVDAEEEFDWTAAPDSKANSVTAMAHIDRVQNIFNEYGIHPCYVVDFPVASQQAGFSPLKKFVDSGLCEIGAQLHPWVNPPIKETLCNLNTYPGNLPRSLEREKIISLRDKIKENFGSAPVAYKAGRYGFGPNTAKILRESGFEIDLSVCPLQDFTDEGGPDYRRFSAHPFWFGDEKSPILELPCTSAFTGLAGLAAAPLFEFAQKLLRMRAPGILSRLGVVDRLMLSPEGYSSDEHIKLTRALYRRGLRTFTWSFHSPSVVPGNTSYVQDEAQLRQFLDSFRRYFDFFFDELGGQSSTPSKMRDLILSSA